MVLTDEVTKSSSSHKFPSDCRIRLESPKKWHIEMILMLYSIQFHLLSGLARLGYYNHMFTISRHCDWYTFDQNNKYCKCCLYYIIPDIYNTATCTRKIKMSSIKVTMSHTIGSYWSKFTGKTLSLLLNKFGKISKVASNVVTIHQCKWSGIIYIFFVCSTRGVGEVALFIRGGAPSRVFFSGSETQWIKF